MKFISKSSNLLIVLRPGLSAQPLTGTPSKPTVSVRFKDGVAEVPDGEMTEMMLAHPGFNGDYISADSVNNVDPYGYSRQESEPQHIITEIKYGTPMGRRLEGGKKALSPEIAKVVQDMAQSMAKDMVKQMMPSMLESALKGLVQAHEDGKAVSGGQTTSDAAPVKAKGKPGRKPGRKPGMKSSAQISAVQTVVNPVPAAESPLAQDEVSA